ncbi:hypothetical protein STEG23_007057 [Scotinomys teguina]
MIKRKSSYRRILEMILSGIDGLLFQKVDHSRCKLKVLDLRAVSLKMWNRWPVFKTSVWSENLAGENPSGTEMKPLVKVVIDLVLRRNPLDSVEAFLVHWVRGREGLMSLCCDKLQIWSMSISHHGEMLNMLDLGSVQELKLFYMDNPTCLLHFSPYLGRMRRLRSLLLCYLWSSFFITPVEKQQVITQFTSQFVKLKHLRSLRLHNTYFLKGHLDELFWWLKAPLESLLVTDCYLSKSDWVHMCEFLCTSQLKHLVVKRCKLKEVDFQATGHSFWDECVGTEDLGCSPQVVRKEQKLEDIPGPGVRQPLKIIVDLCLNFHKLDAYHTYLLQWAKPKKSSLQLCCRKLQVWELPVYTIIEILKVFEPHCVEELELNSRWQLGALAWFAPYLGQMRNLRKFLIAGVYENTNNVDRAIPEMKYVNKFISQFSKLNCLQHLYMNRVYFLTGQMKHLVWCLKSPLETLSITLCQFTQSDMNHLSQCQSLWQLKHLNLSGAPLYHLCFKPIQVLLESVTATLQTLELEGCGLEDSHFSALLPVLSQCSLLTKVNFYDNEISILILKDLLHHTANLSQLTHELYPAPLECYDFGELILDRLSQLCSPLMNTLRAVRQPKVNFGTEVCPHCDERCVYNVETRLCSCFQTD